MAAQDIPKNDPVEDDPNADANTNATGVDADTKTGEEEMDGSPAPAPEFLQNLCILPPVKKKHSFSNISTSTKTVTIISSLSEADRKQLIKDTILLPHISPNEPVSAIRGALSEIKGYAHITNYRMVVEELEPELEANEDKAETFIEDVIHETRRRMEASDSNTNSSTTSTGHDIQNGNGNASNSNSSKKKKKKKSVQSSTVVSPYTCNQSTVQPLPCTYKSGNGDEGEDGNNDIHNVEEEGVVLNVYDDLLMLVDNHQLKSRMGLRMVLERYNLGTVSDHVKKTTYLLDGNAPSVLGVLGAVEELGDDHNASQGQDDNDADKKPTEEGVPDVKAENKGDEGGEKEDGAKESNHDVQAEKAAEEMKKKLEIDPSELQIPMFPTKTISMPTNNLQDFYYLSCGEEERLSLVKGEKFSNQSLEVNQKDAELGVATSNSAPAPSAHRLAQEFARLDEKCKVNCSIAFGGFNPPPHNRRMLGDLAYLEVCLPGGEGTVHVTVIPTGFYINRTNMNLVNGNSNGNTSGFDPSPASNPCFSHELLDCLLLKSPALRTAWSEALAASLERSNLAQKNDDPLQALFRAATHGDLSNKKAPGYESHKMLDAVTLRPSWLVPTSRNGKEYPMQTQHSHDLMRSEEDMSESHGFDFRNGAARDWNEELQVSREMPQDTIDQRIERARLVHKTLCDFGDAAAAGVKGIFKGKIGPMNPNEEERSHVYLHNNIFFSRAIDSGVDTFKIARGDKCARKSASRDAVCVGMLHKLDNPGINTLATVLIDYLGTRILCQSIVPGILLGDKTHQVLYGAVEASSPLSWDKDFHEKLERDLGRALMIASREVPKLPLTDEKMEALAGSSPFPIEEDDSASKSKESLKHETVDFFGSVELKGIRGSDCRDYCLDVTRLSPRDANWVSSDDGGTGKWEECSGQMSKNLDDDEWIVSVIRPELIMRFTSKKMSEFAKAKSEQKKEESEGSTEGNNSEQKIDEGKEESDYLKSLRLNLNVFLPYLRDAEDADDKASVQLKKDESLVREIAEYLWDVILPQITKGIRDNQSQIPIDGKSLTNYLHERGVNCRYLGRLAALANSEEASDSQEEQDLIAGKVKTIRRRSMPLCWLESLECEMVARAAKHVLDGYLTENGGIAASQPSKIIASFLSALVSSSEESAADTEHRLAKDGGENDKSSQVTLFDEVTNSIQIRSRGDVWSDIEKEVERRFMYSLQIFNNNDTKSKLRASLVSLLRRVCQRSGIRLYAKNYSIGGKGLTGTTASYPIATSDIAAILPTMKHAANDGREGFVACRSGADAANACLHILLDDAKGAYDAATMLLNEKKYSLAVDYSQEATNLYQRVTETPLHMKVMRCLDLTTMILYQAQELNMSASHAGKALAISVQLCGFDSPEVVASRLNFAHILLNSGRLASSIKHMRAVLYLTELLGGSHHVELSALYQKIGSIYDEVGNVSVANHFFYSAISRRNNDRVFQGVLTKQLASIYAKIGQLQDAVAMEKQTYNIFRITLGDEHEYTQSSKGSLERYIKDATSRGKVYAQHEKKLKEEAQANRMAEEMIASEVAAEKKKKKKKSKPKSKKKK